MRRRTLFSAFILTALSACATGGGGGGAMPLAIAMPAGGAATYSIADTTVISVDAGGQMFDIPTTSSATVEMSFTESMGALEVTANWSAFEAVLANPMGAPERGTVADIDGDLVFTLDELGNVSVLETPNLRGSTENLFDGIGIAHGMFPRLPGVVATPGMTWTDTVSYSSDQAGTFTETETVYTYTLAGDVEWMGMMVTRIDYVAQGQVSQEGMQMGMAFDQALAGGSEGYVLWDMNGNRMVEHGSSAAYDGLMNMDQVPVPLAISMSSAQTIRLMDGM